MKNYCPAGEVIASWDFEEKAWLTPKFLSKFSSSETIDNYGIRSAYEYLFDNRLKNDKNSEPAFSYKSHEVIGNRIDVTRDILKRETVRYFKSNRKVPSCDFERLTKDIALKLTYHPGFIAYFVVFNVDSHEPGTYFTSNDLVLKSHDTADRQAVCEVISGMLSSRTSNFTIFLCYDIDKVKTYSNYRYRRVLIESGMIMQFIINQAMKIDLFGAPSPALNDSKAKSLLQCEQFVYPLYSCAMGFKYEQ